MAMNGTERNRRYLMRKKGLLPPVGKAKTGSERQRKYLLKKKFGLSIEEWDELFKKQDGRCGICRSILKYPCTDHNHSTGKVRGLLCGSCNKGLGFFKDSPEIMENAIEYLSK